MGPNQAPQDYWTSAAGLKWIEHEQALDAAMAGMSELMLDAAGLTPSARVLDIGCGTGASTLAAARRTPIGEAVGVDISKPLPDCAIDRAREEGVGTASFLPADAQTHAFAPESFDALVPRVGMSFFAQPVPAFQNLGKALRQGGRMAFVCWAAAGLNPWFHIPKAAAEARPAPIPKGDPRAPGPTAFQDIDYVAGPMAQAGLSDIAAEAVEVILTPPDGARGAARAASRVGPAARIMKAHQGDAADADAIEAAVAHAFAPFAPGGEARVPATVNLFTCRV